MWKLTIEDDEGRHTQVTLSQGVFSIGRGQGNGIRLTDRNISRQHASLTYTEGSWWLSDLQSQNGSFVNGERLIDTHLLRSRDVVQLGDYRLEIVDESKWGGQDGRKSLSGASASISMAPSMDRGTLPSVHLEHSAKGPRPNRLIMMVGPMPGLEFILDSATCTVGRSEEAMFSINHHSVSRWHAEIVQLPSNRYEIIDKNSSNGVRINGVKLKRSFLEEGDSIELGDVRLRFVGEGKTFIPASDQSRQLPGVEGGEKQAPLSVTVASMPVPEWANTPRPSLLPTAGRSKMAKRIGWGSVGVLALLVGAGVWACKKKLLCWNKPTVVVAETGMGKMGLTWVQSLNVTPPSVVSASASVDNVPAEVPVLPVPVPSSSAPSFSPPSKPSKDGRPKPKRALPVASPPRPPSPPPKASAPPPAPSPPAHDLRPY